MAPYFLRMKLVSSSWLLPQTILDQTTAVTLGAPRVNDFWCTTTLNRLLCIIIPHSNGLYRGQILPF